MYYLLYMERWVGSDARINMTGPLFFHTIAAAEAELMSYVGDRIEMCAADEIFEDDRLVDVMTPQLIEEGTVADVVDWLNAEGKEWRGLFCAWFFEFMNDELQESWYEVKKIEASAALEVDAIEEITFQISHTQCTQQIEIIPEGMTSQNIVAGLERGIYATTTWHNLESSPSIDVIATGERLAHVRGQELDAGEYSEYEVAE